MMKIRLFLEKAFKYSTNMKLEKPMGNSLRHLVLQIILSMMDAFTL